MKTLKITLVAVGGVFYSRWYISYIILELEILKLEK